MFPVRPDMLRRSCLCIAAHHLAFCFLPDYPKGEYTPGQAETVHPRKQIPFRILYSDLLTPIGHPPLESGPPEAAASRPGDNGIQDGCKTLADPLTDGMSFRFAEIGLRFPGSCRQEWYSATCSICRPYSCKHQTETHNSGFELNIIHGHLSQKGLMKLPWTHAGSPHRPTGDCRLECVIAWERGAITA